MAYSLEQVDLVRERMDVGYAEAKEALDEAGGDVIGALAVIERRRAGQGALEAVELMIREVRRALEGRQITKVRIKMGDQVLTEAPVAVGGLGAMLLAVVSVVGAWFRLEVVSGGNGADRLAE